VVLRRLAAEADEMWSVVKPKANKPWIWIALDAITRQVMAFHVGDRSRNRAKELWAKIPLVYREQACAPQKFYPHPSGRGTSQQR